MPSLLLLFVDCEDDISGLIIGALAATQVAAAARDSIVLAAMALISRLYIPSLLLITTPT